MLIGSLRSSATFSDCRLYRYELRREWHSKLPPYCAIMLNPSTADATRNDPTVLRQIRRARGLGYGSLIVLNVGAGRNTDPRKWLAMADPIGPKNFDHIDSVFCEVKQRKGIVVAGWGNHAIPSAVNRIKMIAKHRGIILHCLGVTNLGQPLHPLYVSYEIEPMPWVEQCRSASGRLKLS